MNIKKIILISVLAIIAVACTTEEQNSSLKLWYDEPAEAWTEALPVGNGRLGAMVYGTVAKEHIQFNEETLWTGEPHDYSHEGAHEYLAQIRELLFEGKQKEAEQLAMKEFMSVPLRQKAYQPFGDLFIEFPGHEDYYNYSRELDIETAICRTSYFSDGAKFLREVFVSHPDQVIVVRLETDRKNSLDFTLGLDADHEEKSISTREDEQSLKVAVKDGALFGKAEMKITTDGEMSNSDSTISVTNASEAIIYLSASTNYVNYKDVGKDPESELHEVFTGIKKKTYESILEDHIKDYQSLFNRFDLNLGESLRDSLPTDERLRMFWEDPVDPAFVAFYVQYGRYLLIASSREGTHPANLQGIWNDRLKPPWDSKYTTNANAGMNYWPAEITNLSECHEPLIRLVEECAETGIVTANEHYNCSGWVLHHNTDIWRGTAPINASNHGIWLGGSGWLSHHLWEHYLFTLDEEYLTREAYPVMRGAAQFYSEFLIEDPKTGWLVSVPSNSPEIGGLVVGPTMDHQIIRSLFRVCIEATEILGIDQEFAAHLKELIPKIAPNQIGQYGQLQEWMEDKDDPENHHRHVSHLWGLHPGNEINQEDTPGLIEAAKQSLILRGDEGTGWSLAWKINYWAKLLDGNHSYELIKMLFRPVESNSSNNRQGGSYINLFDAHPPFQIDGNFGGAAGIVELLIQSHLGKINLLPALPDAFPDGSISGVCARGGFDLSFSWENGELTNVKVFSKAGKVCVLTYGGKKIEFETTMGESYAFNGELIAFR